MNDNNNHNRISNRDFENDDVAPIASDELDALLRTWHEVNAERAVTGRERLMQRLSQQRAPRAGACRPDELSVVAVRAKSHQIESVGPTRSGSRWVFRPHYLRAAASLVLFITALALLLPLSHSRAMAQQIMVPNGGRLDAIDFNGNLLGPCPLKHTDVHVNITGPFSHVSLKQNFHNSYDSRIEAVYTFPLSNRGAVDRMTMTIGDRVIEAEMKERQQARRMYESARSAGHVAGLLEQERPNIFTQSVANIEPGADVVIEISYIEMLQSKDGVYTFDFPMTVAPRYIPGSSLRNGTLANEVANLPVELERRNGLILLGPATFEQVEFHLSTDVVNNPPNAPKFTSNPKGPVPHVKRIIDAATPILPPDPSYRNRPEIQTQFRTHPGINFYVHYSDGNTDFGQIAADGLGIVGGRWFYFEPAILHEAEREAALKGASFSGDTNQVPDASRITPAPVKPPTRAGHDIFMTVSIDTGAGGPAIIDYKSDLHDIICTDDPKYRNLGNKINLALARKDEIPNRDFVLSWRTNDDRIQEQTFAYVPEKPIDDVGGGGFFTCILAPPARVDENAATPRELIFVLDTSGSMSGLPIEKAKAVMSRAIETMRPRDTFNIITFSGDTHILWDRPRPNSEANRNEAQNFLAARHGNGGTEMMSAINAALSPTQVAADQSLTPEQLANLPADGRHVIVEFRSEQIGLVQDFPPPTIDIVVRHNLTIRADFNGRADMSQFGNQSTTYLVRGMWSTRNGDRVLEHAQIQDKRKIVSPLRIVMFLTDGQVGNDMAIIDAVKQNARTMRVFSFGIGDSPNRFLLDGMSQAGRGEVEYVNLNSNPDAAVQRFVTRIGTPVLTDIRLTFSDGVEVTDTIPPIDAMPDLFDVKPMIIHGRFKPLAGFAKSQLKIQGNTGTGPYERTIDLNLSPQPEPQNDHRVIATLWARAKVDELMNKNLSAIQTNSLAPDVLKQIIGYGERFNIMTQYTSFIAIEKARITIAGRTVLVPVPIELPAGMEWEEGFGGAGDAQQQASRRIAAFVDKNPELLKALVELRHSLPNATDVEIAAWLAEPGSGGSLERPQASGNARYRIAIDKADQLEFPWQRGHQRDDRDGEGTAQDLWYGYTATSTGVLTIIGAPVRGASPAAGSQYFGLIPTTQGFSPIQSLGRSLLVDESAQNNSSPQTSAGLVTYVSETQMQPRHRISAYAGFSNGSDIKANVQPLLGDIPTISDLFIPSSQINSPTMTGNAVVNVDDLAVVINNWSSAPKLDLDAALNGSGGGGGGGGGSLFEEDKPSQINDQAKAPTATGPIDYPEDWPGLGIPRSRFNGTYKSDGDIGSVDDSVTKTLAESHVPIDFNGNTLEQIIGFCQLVTGLNFIPDWKSLDTVGIKPEMQVTLKMQDVSIAIVLDRVFAQLATDGGSARLVVDNGIVIITAATVEEVRAKRQAAMIEARRQARLHRVIDQRLWEVVFAAETDDDVEQSVVVLVRETQDATLDQLKSAGLRVDDVVASTKLVAGVISVSKLTVLALIENVRRIEPVNSQE